MAKNMFGFEVLREKRRGGVMLGEEEMSLLAAMIWLVLSGSCAVAFFKKFGSPLSLFSLSFSL